jgi:protein TonB
MPAPRYPAQALRSGEQGTVMVSAEISEDGVPSAVEVARSSGSRQLDRAAVDAVRHWRFRPAMADGRPTTGRVQVPISFKQ